MHQKNLVVSPYEIQLRTPLSAGSILLSIASLLTSISISLSNDFDFCSMLLKNSFHCSSLSSASLPITVLASLD